MAFFESFEKKGHGDHVGVLLCRVEADGACGVVVGVSGQKHDGGVVANPGANFNRAGVTRECVTNALKFFLKTHARVPVTGWTSAGGIQRIHFYAIRTDSHRCRQPPPLLSQLLSSRSLVILAANGAIESLCLLE